MKYTEKDIKKEISIAWKEIRLANKGLRQKPQKKDWSLTIRDNLVTLSLSYIDGESVPCIYNISL